MSAADQDVTVRNSLDRTAMFVGDRAAYTIEITCKRGVDVLADDVSRDKLKLGGLEVVGGDTSRRTAADDSTVYTLRYVLTTYRVDAPALTIGPLSVRYAVTRAGQRLEEAAPAGEVKVPGATLAFRSALPDEPDLSGIRSDKQPDARPMRFADACAARCAPYGTTNARRSRRCGRLAWRRFSSVATCLPGSTPWCASICATCAASLARASRPRKCRSRSQE